MRIIITWSNGTKEELEVSEPEGATLLSASVSAQPDTALRQRRDGRWECFSVNRGRALVGYCLSPEMIALVSRGHPIAGLSWNSIWSDPENHDVATAVARCPWITQADWESDRLQREKNAHKFHSEGHGSEQEAIDCYQQFLSDFGVQEPL
jgi:hypothetical protein